VKFLIPKTKQEYDAKKYRMLMGAWCDIIKENCCKCSVCGEDPRLSVCHNGWQIRVTCTSYKQQPPHGNISNNRQNRRFTEWYTGEDNLKNAIEEWNKTNKI